MTAPTAVSPAPAGGGDTLMLATMNLLNLARPGRIFYPNEEPYEHGDYRRKTIWIGLQLRRLNADVVAVQEVWDLAALKDAVAASRLRYAHVLAPGADGSGGADGTPRVGLMTRLDVEDLQSITDFPPGHAVAVPEIGEHGAFERPVLHAKVLLRNGLRLHVLVAHLKSKRPKLLRDPNGEPLEDPDDPRVQTRAALRHLVVQQLAGTREPMVLMGDLNDGPLAATTQMITATHDVAWDRAALDAALFHAYDVQVAWAIRRDVGYSHIYQGIPDTPDQIWVSEEFVAASRFAIGDVARVEYFNDHLNDSRARTRADHGFVRALLRLR